MHVFNLHKRLIDDYASYITSFIHIRDQRIEQYVKEVLSKGLLWPEPLIQLNPSFEFADSIDDLVKSGTLHPACSHIFRKNKDKGLPGDKIPLYKHQSEAISIAQNNKNYMLTTGTGSGKSLCYFIPIVDHVLKQGPGKGIKAIIVYPVNALANSQYDALDKYLNYGYPVGMEKVRFARYTGQESDEQRNAIKANPPDILITNYVMLELILTRWSDKELVTRAEGLRFLVLDELHTYRGRQGADVALLIRRLRNRVKSNFLQCVGTSATLAGGGSYDEQRKEIAHTAALIFGDEVLPGHVIGETLQRATKEENLEDPGFIHRLKERITDETHIPSTSYHQFINDPLSCWLESALGIRQEPPGRLVRRTPRSISGKNGTAQELSELTGVEEKQCETEIQQGLLAGYRCEANPAGFRPFAFRLHQFISRGGSVYATLEPEDKRYLTVHAQQFVPGDRKKVLFPLLFCRECGQEYYKVLKKNIAADGVIITPWLIEEEAAEEEVQPGYIFFDSQNPWPEHIDDIMEKLPDHWLEEHKGKLRVKPYNKKSLPQEMFLEPGGAWDKKGLRCHFIPGSFQLCLNCGISYPGRRTEFAKLSSLASEGRSTATTILSLSTVKHLRQEKDLPDMAKKILSFTDNRQDASLQAGHLNDFVQTGLLRAAIYKAAAAAGKQGLSHDELALCVFDALDLKPDHYAVNPDVRFNALKETQKALRQVLGYRVYLDLRRGWRVTAPNLEQCGLLEISYPALRELCAREELWENCHPALAQASPANREKIAKVLLDHMRKELAIKVDYLQPDFQERIEQNSSQWLIAPWGIDENEKLEPARTLFPCSPPGKKSKDDGFHVYLSPRSGFGYYLLRRNTFENYHQKLKLEDGARINDDLLDILKIGGMVEVVDQLGKGDKVPGYQLVAAAMCWNAGAGERVFLDPVRFPNQPVEGTRANQYFVDFYRSSALEMSGLEAREHTAQVKSEYRQEREKQFKEGKLPILYCSPTMELGVDIADLNVVNMRNIPPTPANYAQRSGRAGRSGQPALIYTYCSKGNPHDQYFFKRPQHMVSGAVQTPRLDLANEDLVRAHVHAVWLAETGLSLGITLKDILDLSGDSPTLELQDHVKASIYNENARMRAFQQAKEILSSMDDVLQNADWYTPDWLETVIKQVDSMFDAACERWREIYRSALNQYKIQNRLAVDVSRNKRQKEMARRLADEALKQINLLIEEKEAVFSDFYSYRYFATEGFLPGYNFPRLSLRAYIPGRQVKSKDEFLSRSRFLAISEFGPWVTIYHEGSRYKINKVILPVSAEGELSTGSAKCCSQCGYLHPMKTRADFDVCEMCDASLEQEYNQLFQLQNVSTQRHDRINSDEEERLRLGFEIKTGFRFTRRDGSTLYRSAQVLLGDTLLVQMKYAAAATIWRINLGRRRQVKRGRTGFELDTETGYWLPAEEEQEETATIGESRRGIRKTVIPYVEDHRNCLLFSLARIKDMNIAKVASLAAALKRAVQVEFQLEDNELAVEPLPDSNNRKQLLFYEAAEGGAGVLRLLIDEPGALSRVAATALELCHFDPISGENLQRDKSNDDVCEAACYDCLMSYYNQGDHLLLDRMLIKDFLIELNQAQVKSSPAPVSREQHLEQLLRMAGSELEKQWLRFLNENKLNLPTQAQKLIESCHTRPDFWYQEGGKKAAIYIDGPFHQYPERQKPDQEQEECLEDIGIRVIRFKHTDKWDDIAARYPDIFGT
jgi:ATP-dependent helicase YprA (DUF1998 family)/very-short-patch-repair endonuclease